MLHRHQMKSALSTNGAMFAGLTCAVLAVASPHSAIAGINVWTSHGPEGPPVRVSVLAIDPSAPTTLYAGTSAVAAAGTGLFKSTNGGSTWHATGLNTTLTRLVIDPATPTTLYGTTYGGGVLKSTDGGATWKAINTGLPGTTDGIALVIDPITPTTLYAGVYGSGVFKSTDGGSSWAAVNAGLPTEMYGGITITALAVDPVRPSTLYAGYVGQNLGNRGNVGIFKSTDGGTTWVATGLVSDSTDYRFGSIFVLSELVIDPVTPTTLYAGGGDGLIKSTDGGTTWSSAEGDHAVLNTDILALAIDPVTPNTLYAETWLGNVFKTTDGGATWNGIATGPNALVTALAIDPRTPATLYAGAAGVLKSTDAGASWATANTGLPADTSVTTLVTGRVTPTVLYAGTTNSDVGFTRSGSIFKSTNGGVTWSEADNAQATILAVDPTTPTILYARFDGCLLKSTDGGTSWDNTGLVNTNVPPDCPYDCVDVGVLSVDPKTPTTLYAGGNESGVLKSTDGGATWNLGLGTNGNPGYFSIYALAIDPLTPTTLYFGTDEFSAGAGVFKSTDGGATWTSSVLTGDSVVLALAIDPVTPTTLYAGTAGPGVFKSTDGGTTWAAVNAGLSADTFGYISIAALAIDPITPATLYAGTNGDVFKSTNSGASWNAFNTGLPSYSRVTALVIDPGTPTTLYAGTNGRGVFSIQQVSAEASSRATNEGCAILSDGTISPTPWPLLAGCILVCVRRRAWWAAPPTESDTRT